MKNHLLNTPSRSHLPVLLLLLLCGGTPAAAQERPGEELEQVRHPELERVSYFEEIDDPSIQFEESQDEESPSLVKRASFRALGRSFRMVLEPSHLFPSDTVVRWVTSAGEFEESLQKVYWRGRLEGDPDSWLRLSLGDDGVEGMIRTQEEVYFITSSKPAGPDNSRSHFIYRLSDVDPLWDEYDCAVNHDVPQEELMVKAPDDSSMFRFERSLDKLRQQAFGTTLQEADVHLVVDGLYHAQHGSASASRVAGIMNNVAGIYENEVGVTFRIPQITVYTAASDPFSAVTSPSGLLNDFTFDNPHLQGNDLAHLFTGRDLDSSVIGIAWIGVVCNTVHGTGLSQDLSSSASRTILTAHELGHNFDSIHDDVSGCGNGFIMWPSLDPSANQFSTCSKTDIANHVATRSCLADVTASPPGAPVQLSPAGTIATSNPTYSWQAEGDAAEYKIFVRDSTGIFVVDAWFTAVEAGCGSGTGTCSVAPATSLESGNARWWVLARNESGDSPWSVKDFTVPGDPPSAPTPLSPQGAIGTTTPSYSWSAVGSAAQYKVFVRDSTGIFVIGAWFTAVEAGCGSGTGTCSVAPGTSLAPGNARWWVLARNASGDSPWGVEDFTVPGDPPSAPTPLSPQGAIGTTTPSYSWSAVGSAAQYKVFVRDSTGIFVIGAWFTAVEAGCGSGTGTCSVTPGTSLAPGNARWWVLARNASGDSPWALLDFVVN